MTAWEHKYDNVDGIKAHYLEAGDGPTLLLVHGGGLTSCAELNYGSVIGLLSRRFRVLAVDIPGYGLTEGRGPEDYLPRSHGDFVISFLRRLTTKAHVAGNSRGAWIAQYVVHEAPELVDRLILINSMSVLFSVSQEQWDFILKLEVPSSPPTEESIQASLLRFYVNKSLVTQERVAKTLEYARKNYEYAVKRQVGRGRSLDDRNAAMFCRGKQIAEWAGQIDRPVLLAWSRENYGATPADAAKFLDKLSRDHVHELHVFANAGHHVHTEHPHRWTSVVSDFLNAGSTSNGGGVR